MAWNKNHVLERVVLDMLASYQPLYVFTDDRQKLWFSIRILRSFSLTNCPRLASYQLYANKCPGSYTVSLIRCPRLANNRLYV